MSEKNERRGLRFKDLQAFNEVLLAKQLWHLITQPNSLMYRVMKQMYLPKNDLFQARVNSQASWLWKRWAFTRDLIRDGCAWRVGDGKSDKWLPATHLPKPVSLKPEHCEVAYVADLMASRNMRAGIACC